MRLIDPSDADNRERTAQLEQTARQAAVLINRYEEIIACMQKLAVSSGAVPEGAVKQINPIQFCHEAVTNWAIAKLRE
jgi:hypothetical protein